MSKAQELKNKGNKFFSQKNYTEAIKWYTKAIAVDPNQAAFYSNRSAAYMGLNNPKDALKDAESCINAKPDWVKGHYRRALALMELERYSEAAKSFEKAVQLDPSNEDIKSKYNSAKDKARFAVKKVDDDGNPLSAARIAKEEGNVYFRQGKYELAIEKYGRAIALAETEDEKAVYYSNRALAYAQVRNHEQVVSDCTEAINRVPTAKVHIRRGLAYEMLERYKKGLADMKCALSLDPNARVASEAISRLTRAVNSLH
eukprot:TRINITY_DN119_c0_g2_i3.p1 TRINITY_DN119_c0_g2~~TRINITY_DN119_c0_g2_i3.p1  ORF type:complete len:258 (+),score=60.90 TRINITY_DN119_c0_g2_i3:73-846(+)